MRELASCILGSRVQHAIGLEAVRAIERGGLLDPTWATKGMRHENRIYRTLRLPLKVARYSVHYRFPRSRARYLRKTVANVYSGRADLRRLLRTSSSEAEARRDLIKIGVGIGPKQASLFLRNIGYAQRLAILDSHVLRYMRCVGLMRSPMAAIPNISQYELAERRLILHADTFDIPLAYFDFAVWVVMRVALREGVAV